MKLPTINLLFFFKIGQLFNFFIQYTQPFWFSFINGTYGGGIY